MISCRDAKHLFDRYLDGELSASLTAEMHAHRLHCGECQNELGLLEACGDVIASDRREPMLSPAFTARVLAARPQPVTIPVYKFPRRTMVKVGAPMAAAACVVFLISSMALRQPSVRKTAVLANQEAMPKKVIQAIANRPLTADEQAIMDAMPVTSAAGFMEGLLSPIFEGSRTTAEGARLGAEGVVERLRKVLADTNNELVVDWRSQHPQDSDEQNAAPADSIQTSPESTNSDAPNPMGEVLHNPS